METQPPQDLFKNTELGLQVSSTLRKLEYISDHHVKERRKHFIITNIFVKIVSGFLLIIGLVNIYYLFDFYQSTMNIIETTHRLDETVVDITSTMNLIDKSVSTFEYYMKDMPNINDQMKEISGILPDISQSMNNVHGNMQKMNSVMSLLNHDLNYIEFHVQSLTTNVNNLNFNIHNIAEPMGKFNSILP
ncbi:MAG: methyl-accepting chemotaxis protein [Gammaproteobacteria bacterium]|nr:methyl-accepting chemotaxis protein [Gammaproteobacteria bacterium]